MRGIRADVRRVDIGAAWDPETCDIVLVGGGQDREQRRVEADLLRRGQQLRDWRDAGGVSLAVCGGYQLFGRHYRGIDGDVMEGVGVFDAVTIHPGADVSRCVGNVAALWEGETSGGLRESWRPHLSQRGPGPAGARRRGLRQQRRRRRRGRAQRQLLRHLSARRRAAQQPPTRRPADRAGAGTSLRLRRSGAAGRTPPRPSPTPKRCTPPCIGRTKTSSAARSRRCAAESNGAPR